MSSADSSEPVEYRLARGCSDYLVGTDASVWRRLTPQPGAKGRWRISLELNGKRVMRLLHRLLLETFVGPCPPGHEGRHLDDDHDNNDLDNLRWGTRAENDEDKRRNGRVACGSRIHCSKLDEKKVRLLRRLHKKGWGYKRLGRKFGVAPETAYYACSGKTWKHVKDDEA